MGRPPLRAQDFMANNPEHLELLRRMGVSLIHLKDGRVQLVQHATQVLKRQAQRKLNNSVSSVAALFFWKVCEGLWVKKKNHFPAADKPLQLRALLMPVTNM